MKFLISACCLCLLISACEKESSDPTDDRTQVSFTYAGQPVTYDVIQRTYSKGPNGEQLLTPVTKYWMDRNLGAERAAQYPNDSLARGDLFQWGRLADGHQKRNSPTTDTLASTITPGHGKFIICPRSPFDWLSPIDFSLWSIQTRTNNVCPWGWHISTADELNMERLSWTSDNIVDSFNSALRWVPTGLRDDDGTIRYLAQGWAFVWAISSDSGRRGLIILGDGMPMIVSMAAGVKGLPVRCVKD